MPRKARKIASGALHHIILRGINRRKIFFDDSDQHDFLDRPGGILYDCKTPFYVWVFLTDHTHLLLRTGTVVFILQPHYSPPQARTLSTIMV
jgi:putative transposase